MSEDKPPCNHDGWSYERHGAVVHVCGHLVRGGNYCNHCGGPLAGSSRRAQIHDTDIIHDLAQGYIYPIDDVIDRVTLLA